MSRGSPECSRPLPICSPRDSRMCWRRCRDSRTRLTVKRVGGPIRPSEREAGLERMSGGRAQVPRKLTWKLKLVGGPARAGHVPAFTGRSTAFTKSCIQCLQLLHSATHCCRDSLSIKLASMTAAGDVRSITLKRKSSKASDTSRCGTRLGPRLLMLGGTGDPPMRGAMTSGRVREQMTEALSPKKLVSLSESSPTLSTAVLVNCAESSGKFWLNCGVWLPSMRPPPVSPTSQIPIK
mmetsp:Transcript_52673/g.150843  ORF Transcript_52673/g.150843 Transcript_52673/m.150843 type:complete len:237 (-) Transcript_52673:979-1689(-)